MALSLTACAASSGKKLQPVNLPSAPECMSPVPKPAIKPGMDARVALLKTDAALGQANGRLACSRKWYEGVRRSYAKRDR